MFVRTASLHICVGVLELSASAAMAQAENEVTPDEGAAYRLGQCDVRSFQDIL